MILKKVPTLPRLGLTFSLINPTHLDDALDHESITYCGRGPHENYIDRNLSALQGVYSYDFAHHYIVPSECGNRTDVRWLNLLRQFEIQASNGNMFQFSANTSSPQTIDKALHTSDIPDNTLSSSDRVYVNVDFKQMGVGGDCSWFPCVYDEFKVNPMNDYFFEFTIRPI